MTTRNAAWLAACSAMCLTACVSTPDFDSASIVDRPRVLAIVAEPPEVAPGEAVKLSLLLAAPAGEDPSRYTIQWSACGAFSSMIQGTQYGDEPNEKGCGGALSFPLGTGTRAVVPGALGASLFENLDLAAAAFGAQLPKGTVEAIRSDVGLPLLVEATVETGTRTLHAVKRVLITGRGDTHHNPPAPHFDFDTIEIVGDPSEPGRCRSATGKAVRWPADDEVELAPRVDTPAATIDSDAAVSNTAEVSTDAHGDAGVDGGEPWVERYSVLNARGELVPRTETACYSWFSTAGRFDQAVTKSPLRNQIWRTPGKPGRYPLWLVVRDGHGGTSACELEVEITR